MQHEYNKNKASRFTKKIYIYFLKRENVIMTLILAIQQTHLNDGEQQQYILFGYRL